ncbi:MAG: phosphomannomutase/phosphoglucomutase [Kiritimatiellae bacterium]|nr:phosphomannomutase/phosphoglucomutase [Kiritimatiellia bacterium]MBP5227203.1 phosphomannomutase/phosphoglucomutase [Kiritimatiellia bacterium]
MSFFKAYDMRGEFGVDFDLDTVYRVGRWLPVVVKAHRILIGRDCRLSSEAVRDALKRGLTDSGAQVEDMGLATTPMVYFMTAKEAYDASVQITASHNPPNHNGMKVSSAGALPVGYDTGLAEIERQIQAGKLPPKAPVPGTCREVSYRDDFIRWLSKWDFDFSGLRFAVDCSDGMASLMVHDLFGESGVYLNDTPDGHFPHHSPNPLDPESQKQASQTVREQGLDAGVIFDGDADRVMFVDERGEFVPPDCILPIIARYFLRREPGATVIHDIRTSRGAIEALHADGARTVMGKVGHAYAKILLRKEEAVCGGELAGHYYFRDFYCCDSAGLAAMVVLSAIREAKAQGMTFSQLMAPIRTYANSGELNFRIADKEAAIAAALRAIETFGKQTGCATFDGVRVELEDGWVNIRPSNTEPYLRMIAEATSETLLAARLDVLKATLRPFTE